MLGEGTTALTYYQAQVKTYADYYPFCMEMQNRTASSPNYRYGFNGKEKDQANEFSAGQTHYDYGFRIYNPVWGRFLSVDPLSPDYPWYTPYQFAGNMPVWAKDLDGAEPDINWQTDPKYGYAVFVTVCPTCKKDDTKWLAALGIKLGWNIIIPAPLGTESYIAEKQFFFDRTRMSYYNIEHAFIGTVIIPKFPALQMLPVKIHPIVYEPELPKLPELKINISQPVIKDKAEDLSSDDNTTLDNTHGAKPTDKTIVATIRFKSSSNHVLDGWNELVPVIERLQSNAKLRVIIMANVSYPEGTPLLPFNYDEKVAKIYDEVTGKEILPATAGQLMDIRAAKSREALIGNGIDPSRISTARGTIFAKGESCRTVNFEFAD
jgi:RHS repeat-associated protein